MQSQACAAVQQQGYMACGHDGHRHSRAASGHCPHGICMCQPMRSATAADCRRRHLMRLYKKVRLPAGIQSAIHADGPG